MSVTPEIEAEIMRLHDANPKRFSPFRAANKVGATMAEVIAVITRNREDETSTFEGGVARPELEHYIVASRRVTQAGWDNQDVGVARARQAFEDGTHTMATHRDGDWLHLCLFQLKRPVKARPGYFKGVKL